MKLRFPQWRWRSAAWVGGILGFAFLVALVMNITWGGIPDKVEVGKIAPQDIRADKDYEIADTEATEALQKEALEEAETELQKERALADVKPVIIKVQAGESIIRSGDPFQPRHLKIIEGIRREKTRTFGRARLIGSFLFVGLFLGILSFGLFKNSRKTKIALKDLLFLGSLLLVMIGLQRAFLFVSDAVRGFLPIDIPLSSFYGLLPIAAGTMMVRLLFPLPVAILFIPVHAALAGLLLQGSLHPTLYFLIESTLSIPLMVNVRTRGQILKVGLQLGIVNALTLLSLDMISITSVTGVLSVQDSGLRLLIAFFGGVLSSIVVLILMPVVESLFNYLTPIKLLEYGSLNHPILREMIVRAPGTYHHSHMVGTLAEAAAEAIGADSLFARVASYFHDIGKMKKAPYFIENQGGGEDRHAPLSPSMSALIIASHVKDGIEVAKEYKLPQKIIDIIPQHQGTKLIGYFYNKAKEAGDRGLGAVSENDYRYPGPKPQTREAGIILLADTAEAATRALKDRSSSRLEEVVRNMINKNFIDGQLDECELTLKDLHTIAKSFVRILVGIYHQRIEYPPDATELSLNQEPPEAHLDKYHQPKLLREDSLHETSKGPSTNIRRLRPESK